VRLGDLLIRAKLITEKDVAAALERLKTLGGRMGDHLVAIGAIDQAVLDGFIHRIPKNLRILHLPASRKPNCWPCS